jgi:hypothetical protein
MHADFLDYFGCVWYSSQKQFFSFLVEKIENMFDLRFWKKISKNFEIVL